MTGGGGGVERCGGRERRYGRREFQAWIAVNGKYRLVALILLIRALGGEHLVLV